MVRSSPTTSTITAHSPSCYTWERTSLNDNWSVAYRFNAMFPLSRLTIDELGRGLGSLFVFFNYLTRFFLQFAHCLDVHLWFVTTSSRRCHKKRNIKTGIQFLIIMTVTFEKRNTRNWITYLWTQSMNIDKVFSSFEDCLSNGKNTKEHH